jgi:hypothetical protein
MSFHATSDFWRLMPLSDDGVKFFCASVKSSVVSTSWGVLAAPVETDVWVAMSTESWSPLNGGQGVTAVPLEPFGLALM